MADATMDYNRQRETANSTISVLEIRSATMTFHQRIRPLGLMWRMWLAGLLCGFVKDNTSAIASAQASTVDHLTEDSVVMITGAAGVLGSELALALFRTYDVKHVVCVDRLLTKTNNKNLFTPPELALLEFQRQRAFTVLQTLGDRASFYRVDFRPMIPEYFDLGELPALHHIFQAHPDITHIVHLADPFPHSALQVVPREPNVPRAGMMDALLEQIRQLDPTARPHFTYASSYEVYPLLTKQSEPFKETMTLSTPQSLRGASKLMDEFLAKLYHEEHGLFSVGLRFFSVYGPWNVPGSPWFEMAERAVQGQLTEAADTSIMDFVYLDDAIDAILLAMQTRRSEPFVVNVASGEGTSWKDLTQKMIDYFPIKNLGKRHDEKRATTKQTYNVGSIHRARDVLGYQPRVSLDEGLRKVLAWHWDRAYPNGGDYADPSSQPIVSQGMVSCLPTDAECLHAAPVFPCASECSHFEQCTKSYWDVVLGWTQALTQRCQDVLYTVALDPSMESIPSAHIKVQPNSNPFIPEGTCNLAFVSTASPLVQSLRGGASGIGRMSTDRTQLLRTGSWILIPIESGHNPAEEPLLALLPKLSPGLFFSVQVQRAVYVDPDVLVDSLPKMLRQASMQPQHPTHPGATALLIGKRSPLTRDLEDGFIPRPQVWESTQSRIQKSAYRMIRIALSELGMSEVLDARWMVHRLNKDDARLFRCDVAGEVLQWNVPEDAAAWEFVLGLHDLWSRVVLSDDDAPWWTEETAVTVPEGNVKATPRRRLGEEGEETQDEEADDTPSEEDDGDAGIRTGDVQSGFGMGGDAVEEIAIGVKRSDSIERDDDQTHTDEQDTAGDEERKEERDLSSMDIWMGVLSASSVKYFVRIVPSNQVGVVSLADYEQSRIK